MKKTFLLIVILTMLTSMQAQVADTAAMIVDRYESILNMKMLPRDSMIVVTSIQIDRDNPTDTVVMRRWDAFPNKSRSEVWYKSRMLDGLVSDGKSHLYYDTTRNVWRHTTQVQYLDNQQAFDIRGPLYYWRTNGSELTFHGEKMFQGHPVYSVEVAVTNSHNREYFFEKETGMLFLYRVLEAHQGDSTREEYKTDWRAYHEYQQKGPCIFPAVESYQNTGHVYIIHHQVEFLPVDDKIFFQEQGYQD